MNSLFPTPHPRGLQADIHRLCGVSRPAVSAWFNTPEKVDTISREHAELICQRYVKDVSPAWLATGKLPREATAKAVTFDANVSMASMGTRKVPLISSIQAGLWAEIVDNFVPGDAEEWLLTDVKCSQSSFALTIKGNSMEPGFSDGDRVIIDPEVTLRPGSYVAAKNGSEEATFKKYRPRGINASGDDVFELVPLNEDYPSLHSDREPIRIIGTAVEHRRRLA